MRRLFVKFGADGLDKAELGVFEVKFVEEWEVGLPLGGGYLWGEAHWKGGILWGSWLKFSDLLP